MLTDQRPCRPQKRAHTAVPAPQTYSPRTGRRQQTPARTAYGGISARAPRLVQRPSLPCTASTARKRRTSRCLSMIRQRVKSGWKKCITQYFSFLRRQSTHTRLYRQSWYSRHTLDQLLLLPVRHYSPILGLAETLDLLHLLFYLFHPLFSIRSEVEPGVIVQ